MHFLQVVFFWMLVLGAAGFYACFTKTEKNLVGTKESKLALGTEDPMVRVALAILALVFRPW
jgi:hypothetical protein